jgi:hypothetical protein
MPKNLLPCSRTSGSTQSSSQWWTARRIEILLGPHEDYVLGPSLPHTSRFPPYFTATTRRRLPKNARTSPEGCPKVTRLEFRAKAADSSISYNDNMKVIVFTLGITEFDYDPTPIVGGKADFLVGPTAR